MDNNNTQYGYEYGYQISQKQNIIENNNSGYFEPFKISSQLSHQQNSIQDLNINSKSLTQWQKQLKKNDNTISYTKQFKLTDKNKTISNPFLSLKNSISGKFNKKFVPLTYYEFHMIQHLYKLFKELKFQKLAESIVYDFHIPRLMDILKFQKQVTACQLSNQTLKSQINKDFQYLLCEIQKCKYATKEQAKSCYTIEQTNILLMILIFYKLENNYCPYRRKLLKRIFNQLQAPHFTNVMQTLRYLQNERQIIQNLRHLSQLQLNSSCDNIIKKTFQKYGKADKIPIFALKKISQNQRRQVVNFLVSGFLSQGVDKRDQWLSLLNCMPDSQVYGLDWQSQNFKNLLTFMVGGLKNLIISDTKLDDLFENNPFNPAFKVAQDTGRYLAHIVHQIFPDQFINIIGYSLGVQVIKQFIKITLQLNGGKNLQRIVLCGGVSDAKQYAQIFKTFQFPISLTNLYTKNDQVLQRLLKRCRKGIQPVGLQPFSKDNNHCIDNNDASQHIIGHLAYMIKFGKIAELLQLNQQ